MSLSLLSIPEVPRPTLCRTSTFKCAPGLGHMLSGLDYLDWNGILQQQKETIAVVFGFVITTGFFL